MKRLKVAVAILLVIPLFLIGLQIYLHRTTDHMSHMVAQATELTDAGEKEKAAQQVTAFQHKWIRDRGILAMFIKHSELDVVNLSAARLPGYLHSDDIGEFDAETAALRTQLEHLWKSEQFNLENIL